MSSEPCSVPSLASQSCLCTPPAPPRLLCASLWTSRTLLLDFFLVSCNESLLVIIQYFSFSRFMPLLGLLIIFSLWGILVPCFVISYYSNWFSKKEVTTHNKSNTPLRDLCIWNFHVTASLPLCTPLLYIILMYIELAIFRGSALSSTSELFPFYSYN